MRCLTIVKLVDVLQARQGEQEDEDDGRRRPGQQHQVGAETIV